MFKNKNKIKTILKNKENIFTKFINLGSRSFIIIFIWSIELLKGALS